MTILPGLSVVYGKDRDGPYIEVEIQPILFTVSLSLLAIVVIMMVRTWEKPA